MFLSQIDVLSHSPSLPLSLKSVSMSSGEDKKKSDAVPFDPAAFREGSPGISIEYRDNRYSIVCNRKCDTKVEFQCELNTVYYMNNAIPHGLEKSGEGRWERCPRSLS